MGVLNGYCPQFPSTKGLCAVFSTRFADHNASGASVMHSIWAQLFSGSLGKNVCSPGRGHGDITTHFVYCLSHTAIFYALEDALIYLSRSCIRFTFPEANKCVSKTCAITSPPQWHRKVDWLDPTLAYKFAQNLDMDLFRHLFVLPLVICFSANYSYYQQHNVHN